MTEETSAVDARRCACSALLHERDVFPPTTAIFDTADAANSQADNESEWTVDEMATLTPASIDPSAARRQTSLCSRCLTSADNLTNKKQLLSTPVREELQSKPAEDDTPSTPLKRNDLNRGLDLNLDDDADDDDDDDALLFLLSPISAVAK
eukprot:TRINITY_DN702_c0_g1_i1.p2 TRINITY_DN702_c0_g1~~TRINITY_DN702_c0_g1_i1.p2  ORF type:complete len:151 (+),score=44.62 TRINITY_DN702_c0_g1_i1:126-578(+)